MTISIKIYEKEKTGTDLASCMEGGLFLSQEMQSGDPEAVTEVREDGRP